jgi:hypothetical protein
MYLSREKRCHQEAYSNLYGSAPRVEADLQLEVLHYRRVDLHPGLAEWREAVGWYGYPS